MLYEYLYTYTHIALSVYACCNFVAFFCCHFAIFCTDDVPILNSAKALIHVCVSTLENSYKLAQHPVVLSQ